MSDEFSLIDFQIAFDGQVLDGPTSVGPTVCLT